MHVAVVIHGNSLNDFSSPVGEMIDLLRSSLQLTLEVDQLPQEVRLPVLHVGGAYLGEDGVVSTVIGITGLNDEIKRAFKRILDSFSVLANNSVAQLVAQLRFCSSESVQFITWTSVTGMRTW